MKVKARIDLEDLTVHNIKQMKRINQVIFPVFYTDKFYADVLKLGKLAKLVFFNDIVVGAVACRVETIEGVKKMYIMTLGCLPSFRRFGVGTVLLNHVIDMGKKNEANSIYLHVQINNNDALEFYKKHNFKIMSTREDYYKKVEPHAAYILELPLS